MRIDPGLLRVSMVLNTLKQHGIEVQRFNLTSAPMEFVNHPAVGECAHRRQVRTGWVERLSDEG